jgi:hypothetical protein
MFTVRLIKKCQASPFEVPVVTAKFYVIYFTAYFISLDTCWYYPKNNQTPDKYSKELGDLP